MRLFISGLIGLVLLVAFLTLAMYGSWMFFVLLITWQGY